MNTTVKPSQSFFRTMLKRTGLWFALALLCFAIVLTAPITPENARFEWAIRVIGIGAAFAFCAVGVALGILLWTGWSFGIRFDPEGFAEIRWINWPKFRWSDLFRVDDCGEQVFLYLNKIDQPVLLSLKLYDQKARAQIAEQFLMHKRGHMYQRAVHGELQF